MKALFFVSTRLNMPGLFLTAVLAAACSSGASKLRDAAAPVPDGAGERLPEAGTTGSGGATTGTLDAPTVPGGSGGFAGTGGGGTSGGAGITVVGSTTGGGVGGGGNSGMGGSGGGGDAGVPDAPAAQPDAPIGGSVGGAGGLSDAGGIGGGSAISTSGTTSSFGGTMVSAGGTVFLGGTTGLIGGTIGTRGGTTTGGAGGVGGGMTSTDAGVAGAGDGGNGGVLASADANCGITTANLTKQPADLLLVLDRSGSMTSAMDSTSTCALGSTTCQQRWATMVSGLNAVLSSASGDVNWGLELFNSDGACGVPAAPVVPIAPGSSAIIQATIAGVTPGGSTPTRLAINNAAAYLKTLTDTNGKYILLATDGEPNCLNSGRDGGGGAGAADVPGTVAAIAAAASSFKVYVIGIGPEIGNLDNFAMAGGTGHYYPALSPQDLNAALAAIVGAVASCTFSLGNVPPDPSNVAIEFNGDSGLRAPRDTTHTNGWDYTSAANTAIQLYGSWCDNLANGAYTSARILMGCPDNPIR